MTCAPSAVHSGTLIIANKVNDDAYSNTQEYGDIRGSRPLFGDATVSMMAIVSTLFSRDHERETTSSQMANCSIDNRCHHRHQQVATDFSAMLLTRYSSCTWKLHTPAGASLLKHCSQERDQPRKLNQRPTYLLLD